ncbi:MAG: hypothetical protein OXC00_06625 [Acidimicrobiaceae bacterium]|nr:hypothetical protein [Acidimicrobiaceae bacterium]
MATTQAQRAALFNTLTELMGQDDAETLTEQLPPGGWDTMATKDDIKVLGATMTAGLAEAHAAMAVGFAHATEERAKLLAAFTTAIADTNTTMAAGFTHATEERAKIITSQARHLYVTVATIVVAAASIWIALFVAPVAS